jgi:sugar (pentulose or hexulose) kinase
MPVLKSTVHQTAEALVLAIDLGTSSVKVALIDPSLRVWGKSTAPYPTTTLRPGQAEQDPADWLDALAKACDRLSLAKQPDLVAVALTGQLPTLVPATSSGTARGQAITWQDSRADSLVDRRLTPVQRRRVSEISGAPIDGRYLIPMELHRAERDEPPAQVLLSAKDYLFAVLTGTLLTEPSTASGYGCYDFDAGNWSDELLALWGIERDRLPALASSRTSGRLVPGVIDGVAPGTPVVLGAADSVCAHHYLTALAPKAVSVSEGSSTVILAQLEDHAARPTDLLVTPLTDRRQAAVEMDLLATGSSLAWLAGITGGDPLGLERLALNVRCPQDSAVLFFPYLAGGEQGALWREDLMGTIAGVSLSTTAAELALALNEGIAFETLRCLRRLDTGEQRPVIAVGAPGSTNLRHAILDAVWPGPVQVLAASDPSVLGAALLGFQALGIETSCELEEVATLPRLSDAYTNSAAARAARYLSLEPGLRALPSV